MARNRQRKTSIGLTSAETMQKAIDLHIAGLSLRKTAERTGVPFVTLHRYVKKQKQNPGSKIRLTPKYNARQIFTSDQEKDIVNYLLTASKMCFGLNVQECRKLAYEVAVTNNMMIPENWHLNNMAGKEWFLGFKKRHRRLSIRSAEGCSLSRMTAFNKHNVDTFFNKLEQVYARDVRFADGSRVYNLDETSTTTVQNPRKIIAEKGIKQVNKCTSGERGQNVTTCCIINALGIALPPAMIFPRKNYKEHMINGAPAGTLGMATTSGWMTKEIFLDVLKHFVKHTSSSKKNPTLLIMDNHESHISIGAINEARDKGVTILTLPPHCSHRLQPLDVSVFAAFKAYYNAAVDNWMLHHPAKPITIYQVAECVGAAHDRAMTPSNIKSGFKRSGIFPLDRHIFGETDFLSSAVTDRPEASNSHDSAVASTSRNSPASLTSLGPENDEVTENAGTDQAFISPSVIRGFPKAGPRKNTTNRRKGRTMIATDTPEKNTIEEKETNKHQTPRQSVRVVKKKILESSDEDEEDNISLYSETEDWRPEIDPNHFENLDRSPCVGDFVLVAFEVKEKTGKNIFYIGKVLETKTANHEFKIQFYRRSRKMVEKFVLPNVPDIAWTSANDIKMILPHPQERGKTKRQTAFIEFEVGFENIELR